ncbi:hypothetical protein Xen7305DRAFT_00046920, partial [Xenococcus sp. PCC 7305]
MNSRPLAKYFCGRVKGLHFSCTSFMNYANAKSLSGKKFKRRFGVEKKTFERILEAFKQEFPHRPKAGRPWDLAREEQILVTLEYWREYRTYFHIATDFGVSESTICRVVHRV